MTEHNHDMLTYWELPRNITKTVNSNEVKRTKAKYPKFNTGCRNNLSFFNAVHMGTYIHACTYTDMHTKTKR